MKDDYFIMDEEVLNSSNYAALMRYFAGETGLEDALDEFCAPIENEYKSPRDPSETSPMVWDAWDSVITVAANTSHTSPERQKLADFIARLAQRADLEKDGKVCLMYNETVWKDLPTFGWQVREAWNFHASDDCSRESQQHWVNLNAWTATIVAYVHEGKQANLDLSIFGLWTIRTALESKEKPPGAATKAAAVWFVYAAAAIGDFCSSGETMNGKSGAPGDLYNDKDWRGYTRDRWQIWLQRLRDLRAETADDEVARLARQAEQAMEKVGLQ